MIYQPILMEAELGKLVWGLTPEKVIRKITSKDKEFSDVLWILGFEPSLMAEDRKKHIEFEVAANFSFLGFDFLPSGGAIAVFVPSYWICPSENGSDDGWMTEKYHLYDRFYSHLAEMTKTETVRADIPDIECVALEWIDVSTGNLAKKHDYWRMRK